MRNFRLVLILFIFTLSGCAALWRRTAYLTQTNATSEHPGPCGNSPMQNAIETKFGEVPIVITAAPEMDRSWMGPVVVPLIPKHRDIRLVKLIIQYETDKSSKVDFKDWRIHPEGQQAISAIQKSYPMGYGSKTATELTFDIQDLEKVEKFELLAPGTPQQSLIFQRDRQWHYVPVIAFLLHQAQCASK